MPALALALTLPSMAAVLGGGSAYRVINFATLTPIELATRFGWSRTGAGTMIDSGQLVKYGAHNLLLHSNNPSHASWVKDVATLVQDAVAPDGTTTAWTVTATGANYGAYAGNTCNATVSHSVIWARRKSGTGTFKIFGNGYATVTATLTTSWQEFKYTGTPGGGYGGTAYVGINNNGGTAGDQIEIWQAKAGMGAAPSDSAIIQTTTAARYLMRSPDYTHSVPGLLLEPARTNLLESGNLGATLATQTKTVTAAAHTLSFFGTGSIVLTGTHSATVTGTGASVLTALTFTPTAGSLTLTVSGAVTDGQLELGSYATSRVPNPTAGTMLREADSADIGPGAEFDALFPPGGTGTLVLEWVDLVGTETCQLLALHNGTAAEKLVLYQTGGNCYLYAVAGGVQQWDVTLGAINTSALNRAAFSWGSGGLRAVVNGLTERSNPSAVIPAPTIATVQGTVVGATAGAWKPVSTRTFRTQLTGAALQALTV